MSEESSDRLPLPVPKSEDGYVRRSPYSEEQIRAILQNKGQGVLLAEFWKRVSEQ
jgi:hypothetical protein